VAGVDIPAETAQILACDGRIVRGEQRMLDVGRRRDRFLRRGVRGFDLSGRMSGLLGTRHELQGRLCQRERARSTRQPIQERLGIDAHVARRREDAGTAGHPTHAARSRVVHGSSQ
jgi:hypothetical protein